jgi:hypothetical protein
MARETKAERLARFAAELQQVEAEQEATYPQRLMAMLERATNANFELEVHEATFFLKDRDDARDRTVALTLTYTEANQEALNELTWRVESKEKKDREAERQYQVKQSALAKLSEEERELLGL